jgi:hypothetical protein
MQFIHLALIALLLLAALLVCTTWAKGFRKPSRISAFNALGDGVHEGAVPTVLEAAVTVENLLLQRGTASNGSIINVQANRPWGIAKEEGVIGDTISMEPLGLGGPTTLLVASGVIPSGSRLATDNGGKVRVLPVAAGTYWVVGYALTAATGDNDVVECVTMVPMQVVVP